MGSFQTLELIETFINYQESIKRCICIIYDPQRTKTGSLKVNASPTRSFWRREAIVYGVFTDFHVTETCVQLWYGGLQLAVIPITTLVQL